MKLKFDAKVSVRRKFYVHEARSMEYNIVNWEMIRTKQELIEKLSFDGTEDQYMIMNNMVDSRACYKPSGKVRDYYL